MLYRYGFVAQAHSTDMIWYNFYNLIETHNLQWRNVKECWLELCSALHYLHYLISVSFKIIIEEKAEIKITCDTKS